MELKAAWSLTLRNPVRRLQHAKHGGVHLDELVLVLGLGFAPLEQGLLDLVDEEQRRQRVDDLAES